MSIADTVVEKLLYVLDRLDGLKPSAAEQQAALERQHEHSQTVSHLVSLPLRACAHLLHAYRDQHAGARAPDDVHRG